MAKIKKKIGCDLMVSPELLLCLMLIFTCLGLLSGYPVAFVLSGVPLIFALLGYFFGVFDIAFLRAFPDRIYGIMTNDMLLAIPLFVFMGVMLEKAGIAEELLETMAQLFGSIRAGLGISVILVGALLAASTGIVGATVVTMTLISLPVMLRCHYSPAITTGVICASGTLGQIIPPSIVLILLGDQLSNAHQSTQMKLGNFSAEPLSIADLFVGAIIPGLILVIFYIIWLVIYSFIFPQKVPAIDVHRHKKGLWGKVFKALFPPLILILIVLGSILSGVATATESASVGAVGAMVLSAIRRKFSGQNLRLVCIQTTKVSSMVFTILIGAAMFSLIFRGFHGDDIVQHHLGSLPGGLFSTMFITMLVIFLLGFLIDFIEIIYVVVPIVAPILLAQGADPVWLGIMIAVNLQTSFLTPPFGFALFYLRGVAPETVKTKDIYKGVMPFITIQLITLCFIAALPSLATWLPEKIYGEDTNIKHEKNNNSINTNYGIDF